MAPTPQDAICSPPFQFFKCQNSGFTGCCTINPCAQSWCPNFAEPNYAYQKANAVPPQSSVRPVGASPEQKTASLTTSPSPAAANKVSLLSQSNSDVVTVFATSEVYVTSQPTTPILQSITLYPTTMEASVSTILAVSVITQTKTRYQSPTAVVTMPALPKKTGALESKSKPVPPFATRYKQEIIAGTVGGIGGVLVAILLIWLFLQWNRKRRVQNLRDQQFDDHPALAGRDANQAGTLLASAEEDQSGSSTPSPPLPARNVYSFASLARHNAMSPRTPYLRRVTHRTSLVPSPPPPEIPEQIRQLRERSGNLQGEPAIPKMWTIDEHGEPDGSAAPPAEADAVEATTSSVPEALFKERNAGGSRGDQTKRGRADQQEGEENVEQHAKASHRTLQDLRGLLTSADLMSNKQVEVPQESEGGQGQEADDDEIALLRRKIYCELAQSSFELSSTKI